MADLTTSSCEQNNETSCSTKGEEFVDQLSEYQFLKAFLDGDGLQKLSTEANEVCKTTENAYGRSVFAGMKLTLTQHYK